MARRTWLLAALALSACGGGGGGGGGGDGGGGGGGPGPVNAPPQVVVSAPATNVEVSRGVVIPVAFTCQDADDEVFARVVADRDGILATTGDAVTIATGLAETGPVPLALTWDTSGVAPGPYAIFVTTDDHRNAPVAGSSLGRVFVRNVSFAQHGAGRAAGMAALPDGSSLVAGHFTGTATFGDGEPGETTFTAAGGDPGQADRQDVYCALYRKDGSLAWVRQAGGPEPERCDGIGAAADGTFTIAGLFRGDAVFGPGEWDETTLSTSSPDSNHLYVASYFADGRLDWAKAVHSGIGGLATVASVARGADGSCFVAGSFEGSVTFGPGEAEQTTLTTLPGAGNYYDLFVARWNADGTLAWARSAGGLEADYAGCVSVLSDGGFLLTGTFGGVATFGAGETGETVLAVSDPTTGSYAVEADLFLARYDADGRLSWVVRVGGVGPTDAAYDPAKRSYTTGIGISPDPDGSCLVLGKLYNTAVFGAGEPNETRLTGGTVVQDSFVARFEENGVFAWVSHVVADGAGHASAIARTTDGGFALAGTLKGSATFGVNSPVPTVLTSTLPASTDVFIARFERFGKLVWASVAGGPYVQNVNGLGAFSDGSFGIAGSILDVATFGAGDEGEATLVPVPRGDFFVARSNADGGF